MRAVLLRLPVLRLLPVFLRLPILRLLRSRPTGAASLISGPLLGAGSWPEDQAAAPPKGQVLRGKVARKEGVDAVAATEGGARDAKGAALAW